MGHYVVTTSKPMIISPLGLVPKSDGGHRLIHDCSLPLGSSVNDNTVLCDKQTYESIDSAVALLKPGYHMAKVDIKAAYRAVAISPSSYAATGLQWSIDGIPTYLIDTRLPFGARPSPSIFHRISQAIKRMLHRRGFDRVVAYQDDFLVVGDTYQECLDAWMCLMQLLLNLGFNISYNKVEPPTTDIVFLGIEISSKTMQLSLPPAKLRDIRMCLQQFQLRRRASKRQLQSLAGKLNYASRVVRGGRTFLRRLLNAINALRLPCHKARIRGPLLDDIRWWSSFISRFNGTAACVSATEACSVLTDACPMSGGAFCSGDFIYTNWSSDHSHLASAPINYQEAFMAATAIIHWAPYFKDRLVYLYSDNMCTVSIINKCTSRNPAVMTQLRQMFWSSALHNFSVRAIYMPGHKHIMADTVSRLHEPGKLQQLQGLLLEWYRGHTGYSIDLSCMSLANHMSLKSLYSIIPQVEVWRRQNSCSMTWWGSTTTQPSQNPQRPRTAHK